MKNKQTELKTLKTEFAKIHFAMKKIDATQTEYEQKMTAQDTLLAEKKKLSTLIKSLNTAWIKGYERKEAIREELAAIKSEM